MAAFIQKLFRSRKSPVIQAPAPELRDEAETVTKDDPRATQREQQRRLLDGTPTEQELAQLATEGVTADIRLEAARRLTSPELLSEVMKHSKGRDKGVYQATRQALQAYKEEARRQAQLEQTIATLISNAGELAHSEDTKLYQARLEALTSQWQEVESSASPEQTRDFLEAVHKCRQRLRDIQAQLQEERRHEEQRQQRQETITLLRDSLEGLRSGQNDSLPSVSALDALLSTQENRWLEATRNTRVSRSEQKTYETHMQSLRNCLGALRRLTQARERIDTLLGEDASDTDPQQRHEQARTLIQELAWPDILPLPPELAQLRKLAEKRPQAAPDPDRQQQEQRVHELQGAIEQLQTALEARQYRESRQLLKTAQNLYKKLDERHSRRFQARMQLLAGQFRELHDWQGFVTQPKQVALCEQMEYLAEQHMDPEAKAERIRELQNEWRELGGSSDRALWTRFKTASDRAFEPCKAYFEAKTSLKQANLEKRRAICQELETFLDNADWSRIDWKGVERIHQAARQEWKQAWPVDFRENRPLQKHFDRLLHQLEEPLNEERSKNEALKRAIVEKAQSLIEHEPLQEAIAKAKALQAQWKTIGITRHREDRKLWQEFRKACDQIFARRDAHRQARQQATAAADQAATGLLSQTSELTSDSTPESLADAATRLENIDPEQLSAPVRERVNAERQRLSRVRQQQQRAETLRQWQQLVSTATGDQSAREQLPEHWRELTAGQAAMPARELVIRAEILAGIDSPESDRQQRMEIQVKRLAEGLGQGERSHDPLKEMEQLVAHWCLGNIHGSIEPALTHRLLSALGAASV